VSYRTLRLDDARERVLRAMSLRKPQREAFDLLHEIFRSLDDDLHGVTREAFFEKVREYHPEWVHGSDFPACTIALATGVGKTRLIGAIAAYLFLSKQAANFLLLAPRDAILRKFESEADPHSRKYLFVDPALVPPPQVCSRGNIESFSFEDATAGLSPNLFIFSPQGFLGADKRVSRASEFTGESVVDYLRSRRDVVAFVDESHHLGEMGRKEDTRAWTAAVRELEPRLQIGMTATPSEEPGANVLFSYDLATCLREKIYTKGVRVIVKQRSEGLADEDWDHQTLDFALDRLRRKAAAVAAYMGPVHFPKLTPALLVCAEDTDHANKVAAWLTGSRGLGEEEVLVTHSAKRDSEDDLCRLLLLDQEGSRVRVVVHVHKLTEGWDVTNVYVIAPLRRMGTFEGAVQTMGRGLRLPAGRRVDDVELDNVDVLCFGKESLNDVLTRALDGFGNDEDRESAVAVTDAESDEVDNSPPAESIVQVAAVGAVEIKVPLVRRVPVEPDLDFDPKAMRAMSHVPAAEFELTDRAVAGTAEGLKAARGVFIRLVAGRVLAGLRYLSEPMHRAKVELLVKRFVDAKVPIEQETVDLDWIKVAEFLKDQIDGPYRKKDVSFAVGSEMDRVTFSEFRWRVVGAGKKSTTQAKIKEWRSTMRGQLLSGWGCCVHEAAAFDTGGELCVARLLDVSSDVNWWARNSPARLRVPTPIGYYEPDFVCELNGLPSSFLIVECKRGDFWLPPDSDARVKARAADAWCDTVSRAGYRWEHWVVLDSDVSSCAVLEDLQRIRVNV
jgi:hypothetical protein